jgi:hypothetical protein
MHERVQLQNEKGVILQLTGGKVGRQDWRRTVGRGERSDDWLK